MTSPPLGLFDELGLAVGRIDGNGVITAPTQAMTAFLAAATAGDRPATLAGLGLSAAAIADLERGQSIDCATDGRHFALRLIDRDGQRWLCAIDATAEHRAASAAMELVRLRTLAASAATLVHDFNNLLNSCLGLAAYAEPHLTDPLHRQASKELGVATQQGAQLARTLARLLARGLGERATVPAANIVDEALAVTMKAAAHRGIRLVLETAADAPIVRTVVAEAVQALWHTLMALIELGPQRITVNLAPASVAIGGGRLRPCARVRLLATGVPREGARDFVDLVRVVPGVTSLLDRSAVASGVVTAALVQSRLGGALLAEFDGDELKVDCAWPSLS